MLPPTCAALMPHIAHANYTAIRYKSYTTSCPVLLPTDQSDWNLENSTVYVLVRCLLPPAPRAVLELTVAVRLDVQKSAAVAVMAFPAVCLCGQVG